MAKVFSVFFTFLLAKLVTADYCEFGLCDPDQYCCGDNKCCRKTLDLWYYCAAVLLVIFAVAVGIRYSKSRSHSAYVLLASQPTENEAS